MPESQRNPALDVLDALVGEWTMAAGPPDGPAWEGEARVRFAATFSADGRTINGRWEIAMDGSTWATDFDLTYTKVG